MSEDERVKRKPIHEVGEVLDTLSIGELEARIGVLRDEIARLEQVMIRKRGALDAAGSIFAPRTPPS